MDMECAPQTGMLNPFLVQLPEMSSTSSTSSRITALPMASTVPKAIVLLTALREDAAPAAQQVVESGVTTKSRVVLRLAHQLHMTAHLMDRSSNKQLQCQHRTHSAHHSCQEDQSGTGLFRSGILPSSLSHRLQNRGMRARTKAQRGESNELVS